MHCLSAALKGCGGRESADGGAVGECEMGGLAKLNNIKYIFFVAPALTDITSDFKSPKHPE